MSRSGVAILILGLAGILLGGQTERIPPAAEGPFSVVEATIPAMQAAMDRRAARAREEQHVQLVLLHDGVDAVRPDQSEIAAKPG